MSATVKPDGHGTPVPAEGLAPDRGEARIGTQEVVGTHPSGARSIAAAVCVVLAALLTLPGAVAFWGQRTLTDGQRYIQTVGPLVHSPEVQAAIATKVTAAIQHQVDVEAILNEAFAGVITDRPH